MNPDPLHVYDPVEFEWEEPEELPRRRDARLVLLAFAGMALIAAVAWALQH